MRMMRITSLSIALLTTVVITLAPVAAGTDTSPPSPTVDQSSVPSTAVELDELRGILLSPEVLDVPPDWLITDIDPSLDPEQLAELDPFLGLVACPLGVLREGPDRRWLGRRFMAPELPLENGLLSIEIVVEIESDDQWAEDRAALDECQSGEQTLLTVSDAELPVDASTQSTVTIPSESTIPAVVPMTTIELLASPTSTVPYPSAFDAVLAHVDNRTLFVVLGGVDMGQSHLALAEQIAAVVMTSTQAT